jgi:XTP/dITP diphosphohydrolase
MKLVIATHNKGKLREYRELLAHFDLEVIGLDEAGVTEDVEETGTTFDANSTLKAEAYAGMTGALALADDSGLVVDALNGEPGVYSARYGGPGLDDAGRRRLLLDKLKDVPYEKRSARFMCSLALHDPRTGKTHLLEGRCEGTIVHEERDRGFGFGYDAVFVPEGFNETFAEMSSDVKNGISHRGKAVAQLPDLLSKVL